MKVSLTSIVVCVCLLCLSGSVRSSSDSKIGVSERVASINEADIVTTPDSAEMPGYLQVNALAMAYPDSIDRIEIRGLDWALLIEDSWYYWAGGRLLPEKEIADLERYVPIRFYNYSLGPIRVREITPELEERLRSGFTGRSTDTRLRSNSFLDSIYGVSSRSEAELTMVYMTFLDRQIRIHPFLVGPLWRVENRIKGLAVIIQEVEDFILEIDSIHGYNWRNIAGTQQRSYHSYGVAVDILPSSFGGGWAYWRWVVEGGTEEWWRIPLKDRWQIPQNIIDAFEAEGFVWGGKWLLFDTMHFEYRPEAIIMADKHFTIRESQ